MHHFGRFWKTISPGPREMPQPQSQGVFAPALPADDILRFEIQHRVSNSLQVIASLALLKAREAKTDEARANLEDMYQRVMMVARVQRQLCVSGHPQEIEFRAYLMELCEGLAQSLVVNDAVTLRIACDVGLIKADEAVNIGLVVSELVINALKHAFPDGRKGDITVAFAREGMDWRLSVSDNGVGLPISPQPPLHRGLGTRIVTALALQMKAKVETVATVPGVMTIMTCVDEQARRPSLLDIAAEQKSFAASRHSA